MDRIVTGWETRTKQKDGPEAQSGPATKEREKMRQANMMFETRGDRAKFLRGRLQEKESRWNDKFQVGRLEFVGGDEYALKDVLQLTNCGVRVILEPPQPEVKRVVTDPAWSKVAIKSIETGEKKPGRGRKPSTPSTPAA